MKYRIRIVIIMVAIMLCGAQYSAADILADAESLIEAGNVDDARKMLTAAAPASDAYLGLARLAILEYDFDAATDYYGKYRTRVKKEKKSLIPGIEAEEARLADAESYLDRVEKIVVIDSITVPKDGFFKAYRLPASAGRLAEPDAIPLKQFAGDAKMAFVSENGDFVLWSATDENGQLTINEASRLTDGTWNHEVAPSDILNGGGDANYPFMMPDGTTLYFASDGDESIGGYDIFLATRDPSTGEYLQPQNIGMPYNSPADDYMLAIDEENGIGWWATDRNLLGDDLTIYVYLTNEMRRNYDPDENDIVSFAKIDDYKSTWGDQDYTAKLKAVADIDTTPAQKRKDFEMPMPGGKVYTTLDDFKTTAGKSAMAIYLKAVSDLEKQKSELDTLRHKFHRGDRTVAQRISVLEQKMEKDRETLTTLRSHVYEAELKRK